MRGLLVAAMLVGTSLPAVASPGRAVRVEHHIADDAPALGPHDAPVTIELFFTPGQVGAHDAYRTLVELQEKRHPTRVRAVFRPVHRNQNTPAITLAAHQRGLFFELMNALSTGALGPSQNATVELAVKVGVSRSAVERAHLDDSVQAALDANNDRKKRLGIINNPEFVINGRPLGATLHAGSATVDNLDLQYKIALDDARRAQGQGVPARALALWGERRALCDDDSFGGSPRLGGNANDDDDPDRSEDDEPEIFAWRLAEMLVRGTGCAIAQHMPSTLDEYNPDAPPRRNTTPLLAKPLSPVGLPSFGAEDAAVPIFVVCNLRARYCQDQIDMARMVAENFPGQVRVLWVPWVDLALDGAENDLTLAQAVLCAAAEGDGWTFLEAAGKAGVTGRSRVDLAVIATTAGLDADPLVACASGPPKDARAIVEAARAAGIGYGPTVVIGGRAYLGGFNEDRKVIARISAELAPGLLEALIPSW